MAFDEGLAERLRQLLKRRRGVAERKMFGGLAFMTHGRMFVGVVGDSLMARVGPGAYESALRKAHVREMDFTGKPMKGYVFVDPGGLESDADLERWVAECLGFVGTLPARPPG